MRIGETASDAEYRMDKQFQNLPILVILRVFFNWKDSGNLLIFLIVRFWKFVYFRIWKIS